MSEQIDWSKAPEWADKHGLLGMCNIPVWLSNSEYTYVDGQQGGRVFMFGGTCHYDISDAESITERQTTTSWSGEGLPPVGVVCECKVTSVSDWVKCEVVAHHNQYAIAYVDDNTVMLSCGIRFRPIRTPEQIAKDERDAAVNDMHAIYMKGAVHGGGLYAIYDAGYRKP